MTWLEECRDEDYSADEDGIDQPIDLEKTGRFYDFLSRMLPNSSTWGNEKKERDLHHRLSDCLDAAQSRPRLVAVLAEVFSDTSADGQQRLKSISDANCMGRYLRKCMDDWLTIYADRLPPVPEQLETTGMIFDGLKRMLPNSSTWGNEKKERDLHHGLLQCIKIAGSTDRLLGTLADVLSDPTEEGYRWRSKIEHYDSMGPGLLECLPEMIEVYGEDDHSELVPSTPVVDEDDDDVTSWGSVKPVEL